jgi:dolichol-phosphate mannosyltransferase
MVAHWERAQGRVRRARRPRGVRVAEVLLQRLYALIEVRAGRLSAGGFDFFPRRPAGAGRGERDPREEHEPDVADLLAGLPPGDDPRTCAGARARGTSRWTLAKKVKLFVDSFVAFSYAPIRFLSVPAARVALPRFATRPSSSSLAGERTSRAGLRADHHPRRAHAGIQM